jgi:hypothetical protein
MALGWQACSPAALLKQANGRPRSSNTSFPAMAIGKAGARNVLIKEGKGVLKG